jgi:hypothetical protein
MRTTKTVRIPSVDREVANFMKKVIASGKKLDAKGQYEFFAFGGKTYLVERGWAMISKLSQESWEEMKEDIEEIVDEIPSDDELETMMREAM